MKKIVAIFTLNIIIGVKGFLDLDWQPKNPAFDKNIYESLLNPELCQEQLSLLKENTVLAAKFIESGLRLPKGISDGNLIDYGNYFQCIGINEDVGASNIEGKHCKIRVPVNQEFQLPELPNLPSRTKTIDFSKLIDLDSNQLKIDKATLAKIQKYSRVKTNIQANKESRSVGENLNNLELTLSLCVPKPCTTQEWMNSFIFNVSALGFEYSDDICRINDDKPWVPADYVAVVVFSSLGFLTLLSTSYDVWQTFILKNDRKKISSLRCSFSLYTNTRRLTTFTKNPGALECLDGIRAISMMWVIIGHTFSTYPARVNLVEAALWTLSIDSTWVTAGPISVDTFFMLSGLLLVYTTAGKFTGMKLVKNLHVFYLNRLLRMFPLLAAAVLMQASFLYRLSDGPAYERAALETDKCRLYWWSTLLYVQNYFNTLDMCLGHTWYLAVDMHAYILSPLVLFWVLGRRKLMAWTALTVGLLCFLIPSTTYIFLNEFPGALMTATRTDEFNRYMQYYYLNTFTRAPVFFVGMMFGYLLHLWKGKKIIISKLTVLGLWMIVLGCLAVGVFGGHPMKSFDWDNQIVDSLVNSFSRVIWGAGVGMIVVFCVHGYGGPLNWFFSLEFWKLPSRLSYGMYLFHFQIMFVTAGSAIAPLYFTPLRTTYRFVTELAIAVMVSFILTVFIDSPFSTIFKLILGGGPRKPETRENKMNENGLNGTVNVYEKNDIEKL